MTPAAGLSFETSINASEVRQAVGRSYLKRYLVVGLIAFAAVTLLRLQRPWRDSWDLITDLISYVVGVTIGILGLGFAALFLSSRETARRGEASRPTKYLVTDDGIEIQQRMPQRNFNGAYSRDSLKQQHSLCFVCGKDGSSLSSQSVVFRAG